MKHDAELYDVSKEAHYEGISLPVAIDGPLMETLTPSPYLESLGITLDQRTANLLRLVRTMLNPAEGEGGTEENSIPVPFMVLRGPLVREDCFTLTIRIGQDAEGKKAITISRAVESNEERGLA